MKLFSKIYFIITESYEKYRRPNKLINKLENKLNKIISLKGKLPLYIYKKKRKEKENTKTLLGEMVHGVGLALAKRTTKS